MPVYNSLTTRDDAAALIPEEVSSEIFANLANGQNSAVMALARQLPRMSRKQRRIPVWQSLPNAYWVDGDTGLKQTSEAAWTNVYLNAEELAVIIPFPESVLDDADYDLWDEVRPQVETAIGIAFDRAVLLGENAPNTFPTDILAGAYAAGNRVHLETSGDIYDEIMGPDGVISKVELDGYRVTGHVGYVGMRGRLRGLRGTDGHPIFVRSMQEGGAYALDGDPLLFPPDGTILDADNVQLISGDWNQLVWAIRQDITWKLLDQAVIQDGNGAIVYNLAQQDMVAMRVVFRAGWALPNPINRQNPTAATRFPFGVLTDSALDS